MKAQEDPADPDVAGSAGEPPVEQPVSATGGPISHAIFRVARLHRMLAGTLLRQTGLYPGQELMMMHLWDHGAQRQSALVKVLDSDAPTITRSVQRLERAGFVRRRPDPTDARASLVEPTPASTGLRVEIEQIWQQLEQYTVGSLDTTEQRTALTTLQELERNLVVATTQLERDR